MPYSTPRRFHVDHRRAVDVAVRDGADLADTGVAHQHVEPAELVDGTPDQALQVLLTGDVDGLDSSHLPRLSQRTPSRHTYDWTDE
jgi:hypothetical protein